MFELTKQPNNVFRLSGNKTAKVGGTKALTRGKMIPTLALTPKLMLSCGSRIGNTTI